MNRTHSWWLFAPAFLIAGSCTLIPPDPNPQRNTRDYQDGVRAESIALARTSDTVYQRRMYDLIRRSHLVRTDSLARLYVRLETAPDTVKWRVRQAIACEYAEVLNAHGYAAVQRARMRAIDSLRQAGFDATRTDERMSQVEGSPLEISRQTCGGAAFTPSRLPDSLQRVPYPSAQRP